MFNEKIIVSKQKIENIPLLYAYKDTGYNDAPVPLIFIFHKLLKSKKDELPLAYALAEKGFFCIIMDMHGHGERDNILPNRKYNFNYIFRDMYNTAYDLDIVLKYMEASAVVPIDVANVSSVGLSIGASVAVLTGCLNKRVKNVVSVIGNPGGWRDDLPNEAFYGFRMYAATRPIFQMEKAVKDLELCDPRRYYSRMDTLPRLLCLNGTLDLSFQAEIVDNGINELEGIYESKEQKDRIHKIKYIGAGHELIDEMIDDMDKWLRAV